MSLWFWGPLVVPVLLALTYGIAAFQYARIETYPRKVRAGGLTGIVRETAKFTFGGAGASLIAGIITEALEPYRYVQDALLGILLVSAVAALLNFALSAAIDNRKVDDAKAVELDSPFWLVVHGVVYGLTFGTILVLTVVICVFGFSLA